MKKLLAIALIFFCLAVPARAQSETPAPFDGDLARLSEILGALHYLRAVCGANDGAKWRNEMQALIDAEAPSGERRRKMEARERDLRVALTGQLRPGVAANEDSVARLTKALVDLRVDYANTWRDEMNALSYLTPVQRAQLYVMRDRLLQRVQEIRDERGGWRRRPASP